MGGLAAGEADEEFGVPAVVEVESERYDGHAFLHDLALESGDLAPVGEERSWAGEFVLLWAGGAILADADVVQFQGGRVALDADEALGQRDVAVADRFDLGADEDDADLEHVVDVEVVPGAAVFDDSLGLVFRLSGHDAGPFGWG